jgi:NaMN:DMB phosphoribosyltransferase
MGDTAIKEFARSEELKADKSDPAPAEYRAGLLVTTGGLAEEAGLRDKAAQAYADAVAIGRRLADAGIATDSGKVGTAEALAALAALTDRASADFASRLDDLRAQLAALDKLQTDDTDLAERIAALDQTLDQLNAAPPTPKVAGTPAQ